MKNLTLERSWFITNSIGDDEFDYVLGELGIPADEQGDINTIEINGITESDVETS